MVMGDRAVYRLSQDDALELMRIHPRAGRRWFHGGVEFPAIVVAVFGPGQAALQVFVGPGILFKSCAWMGETTGTFSLQTL